MEAASSHSQNADGPSEASCNRERTVFTLLLGVFFSIWAILLIVRI